MNGSGVNNSQKYIGVAYLNFFVHHDMINKNYYFGNFYLKKEDA